MNCKNCGRPIHEVSTFGMSWWVHDRDHPSGFETINCAPLGRTVAEPKEEVYA